MQNSVVDQINEYLQTKGKNFRGLPIFRVVWSDEQTENRLGTYNDFYHSIFLRTVTEVRRVPKYPLIKQKWILEQWLPYEGTGSDLLPDYKQHGSYEQIYVFCDDNDNYLPPVLSVIERIMYIIFHPLTYGERMALHLKDEELKEKNFEQAMQNVFDENSIVEGKLKFHEGVSFANLDIKEKK